MNRIAAYCRISTDKEEQLDSLEHQKQFFLAFAQKQGYDLAGLYADEGISGKSIKNRTQFQRLLRDAEAGRFDLIVVKDISRFARNAVDFLSSIRKLKSMGIPCRFITANLGTEDGELVLGMLALVAQEESANLSRRVKFGKRLTAQKGRVPNRIFGYDRVDSFTLRIHSREAETVRLIFRLYAEEGWGLRKICAELMHRGLPSKEGEVWYPRTVERMLTNSIYCGFYVNNKWEVTDFMEGTRKRKPDTEHFVHPRPEWAVISPEIFSQAQKRLQTRRAMARRAEAHAPQRHSSRHPFSNLIRCASCGAGFIRKRYAYRTERVYWKCRNHDQNSALCGNAATAEEAELREQLQEYLGARFAPEALLQTALRRYAALPADVLLPPSKESPEMEQKRLLKLEAKYKAMYLEDLIDLGELKRKTGGIRNRIGTLQQAQQSGARRPGSEALETAAAQIVRAVLALQDLTNEEARLLIDRIEMAENGIATVFLGTSQAFSPLLLSPGEAVDPIVLGVKLVDICDAHSSDGTLSEIPPAISACFDCDLSFGNDRRRVYVTLGQFSIIRLERDSQLLMPAYSYCIPDKECVGGSEDDPCEIFRNVKFPVDEFFPPNALSGPEGYREAKSICT